MNERRQYTEEELLALPVGTILCAYWEEDDGFESTSIWKVRPEGKIELLSHGGTTVAPPISGLVGESLSIEGYDASAVQHEYGNKKLRIYLNRTLDITPGKFAAHAVHAALLAFGVHPGVPVVVLEKGPTKIEQMRIHVRDAGHTELKPGTLTSGTDWPEDSDA